MSIALLVMTDGRADCLERAIDSAKRHLKGDIAEYFLHDDTGDDDYRATLREQYPEFGHIGDGPRRGFGGALARAWSVVSKFAQTDYLFHLEADFTFNRDVDLMAMRQVLDDRGDIVQMALRRQAWAPAEIEAGGVVEMHPDAYTDVFVDVHQWAWLEHRLFYTTNPSLVRMSLVDRGWPDVPQSEGEFTRHLLREGTPEAHGHELQFGYWGRREDGPWVHHIGTERAGHGY